MRAVDTQDGQRSFCALARRVAKSLLASCRATRSRARTSRSLAGQGRQSEDGAADRERPIPRRGLERGKQLTFVRNPRYWGSHDGLPRAARLALHSGRRRSRRGAAAAARSTSSTYPRCPRLVPELRAATRARDQHALRRSSWEHLAIRLGAGGHPALKSKSSGGRSPTGSTAPRSHGRSAGLWLRTRAARQRTSSSPEPVLPAKLGATAIGQPWRADCSSGPAAGEAQTASTLCRRAALATLRDPAGGSRRARTVELIQAQLRRVGRRGDARIRPVRVFFPILPSGDFDLALFAWSRQPRTADSDTSAAAASRTHRLLPAARHARPRPGRPHPRSRQRARVLNSVDAGWRRTCP